MVNLDLNQINYIEAANTKHPSRTEERGREERLEIGVMGGMVNI